MSLTPRVFERVNDVTSEQVRFPVVDGVLQTVVYGIGGIPEFLEDMTPSNGWREITTELPATPCEGKEAFSSEKVTLKACWNGDWETAYEKAIERITELETEAGLRQEALEQAHAREKAERDLRAKAEKRCAELEAKVPRMSLSLYRISETADAAQEVGVE